MNKKIGRREFFKKSAHVGFSAALGGSIVSRFMEGKEPLLKEGNIDIAVVAGSDYFSNTIEAVDTLGGMKKFVSKGSKVAVLPNSQSRHPGSYTNPKVVRAIIEMCKKAGAQEINCLTWLSKEHWESTGLATVVKEAGASLKFVEREEANFRSVPVPGGVDLKEAMIMKEFYNNDVFIDVPITKDHAGNKFTGTLKNLMGLNFPKSNRLFHKKDWKTNPSSIEHLDQCIVDLNKTIKPVLCVVDATEFITTNGPFGPGKLLKPKKVVAGVDRIAIDAYCTTLWGMEGKDIVMIKRGFEQGLGEIDLKKVSIKEIKA